MIEAGVSKEVSVASEVAVDLLDESGRGVLHIVLDILDVVLLLAECIRAVCSCLDVDVAEEVQFQHARGMWAHVATDHLHVVSTVLEIDSILFV